MKVAVVCGGGIVSGKEKMAIELADGLRKSGCELEIVSSFWSDGAFAQLLKERGLPTHRVWFGFISATMRLDCLYMTFAQILRWPQLLAGYGRFLSRFQPNKVIHTNWHSLLTICPYLKVERDIYWVHEVMPKKWQYQKFFRWLERKLEYFVAVSHAVAKSLRDIGVNEGKIRVIHNGIDDPARGALPVKQATDNSKIGIVGQIGAWKGHEDLLKAFRVVLRTHPRAQLQVFGKGSSDYEAHLRRCASELGVENAVIWRGFVKDMVEIYRNIDLLVVPSRSSDPLPTSTIEAAFFEIPAVASRCGGLIEVVEDGVTGCLFEAGDFNELAQHLITLMGNTQLRNRMGRNARARAITLFSRARFVQDFAELLQLEI
jgi:glycosyltransferase involved in cell wall biosynthesis